MAGRRFDITPTHSRPTEDGGRVYVAPVATDRDGVVYFVQQLVWTDRLLLRQAGRPDLVQVSRGSREALRAFNACLRREIPV